MNKCDKYLEITEMIEYCNNERFRDKNERFRSPEREIKSITNTKLHYLFEVITIDNLKYIKLDFNKRNTIINNIKNKDFSSEIKKKKLEEVNYTCQLTGITEINGKLAADHWNPKCKGGLGTIDNCVILNKHLNEQKKGKEPIKWFIDLLLTNFLNICKRTGILEKARNEIIEFTKNYN